MDSSIVSVARVYYSGAPRSASSKGTHIAGCGGHRWAEIAPNGPSLVHHLSHNSGRGSWDDCIWVVIKQCLIVTCSCLNAGFRAETSRGARDLAVRGRAEVARTANKTA